MTALYLLFKAFQPGLFDQQVQVSGHVTKRGTVVAPYHSTRKKRPEPPPGEDLFAQADRKAMEAEQKKAKEDAERKAKEAEKAEREAAERKAKEKARQPEKEGGGLDPARLSKIAGRFNLTVAEVRDALTATPDELVARNEHAENNKMDAPAEFKRYPIGSAQIDEYGSMENRYINFLREFNPNDLTITEAEDGIKQHPTYLKYVQWAKEGKEPPYVFVAQTDKGTLQVTNRRRTLAAREAGKKLKGWFGPTNKETGNPLKYGDIKRAYAEITKAWRPIYLFMKAAA